MFWLDWGDVPKLERAWMDGQHREVLVSQKLIWPNGLTIDYVLDRLVIYGDDARGTMAQQPLTAGAAGVVPRSAPPESLLDTCLAVAEGKMVFPFLDIRRLQADPMQQLTRRERSLLESLSKVLTNRELAEEFGVSPNTVKFHLSNLYERIGAKNRASAIALLYTTRHSGRG